jgi:hypothetical protein
MDEMRHERFAQMTSADAASEKTSGFRRHGRGRREAASDDDAAGEGDNSGRLASSPDALELPRDYIHIKQPTTWRE